MACPDCNHPLFMHDKYGCKYSACECGHRENVRTSYLDEIGVGSGQLGCIKCRHPFFEHDSYGCKHSACRCGHPERKDGFIELLGSHIVDGIAEPSKQKDLMPEFDRLIQSDPGYGKKLGYGLAIFGVLIFAIGIPYTLWAMNNYPDSGGWRPFRTTAFLFVTMWPEALGLFFLFLGIRAIIKIS